MVLGYYLFIYKVFDNISMINNNFIVVFFLFNFSFVEKFFKGCFYFGIILKELLKINRRNFR